MGTLFKDLYSAAFYNHFLDIISPQLVDIDRKAFLKAIFTDEFETFELKQRMAHTAKVLHQFMPDDFDQASVILIKMVKLLQEKNIKQELEYMFLPEYIWLYGLNHLNSAVAIMEVVTQFTSCEFAVRPFIVKYESEMLEQMLRWSKHESNKVRRLASEGSRPRLPWGIGLSEFKKNPHLILPILENLKQDPCEIVRRSVANSLNDISKDNPEVAIELAHKWKGISSETDAIIKHGVRTLLKSGHPEMLRYYQLNGEDISLNQFVIVTPNVHIGDSLEFKFIISNHSPKTEKIRLEYGIYFQKMNGNLALKVYKISERICNSAESISLIKKHSFRVITTRIFYPGEHQVVVIINGIESHKLPFQLLEK